MLPGPPRELRPMFDTFVVPLVKREFADEIFICRTLRTTGIGESRVQEFVEAELQPRCGAVSVSAIARGPARWTCG